MHNYLQFRKKGEMFLDICPNQFDFKNGHSTDVCIYVLK